MPASVGVVGARRAVPVVIVFVVVVVLVVVGAMHESPAWCCLCRCSPLLQRGARGDFFKPLILFLTLWGRIAYALLGGLIQ